MDFQFSLAFLGFVFIIVMMLVPIASYELSRYLNKRVSRWKRARRARLVEKLA